MEIFYINVNLLKELVYLKSQSSTRFFFLSYKWTIYAVYLWIFSWTYLRNDPP